MAVRAATLFEVLFDMLIEQKSALVGAVDGVVVCTVQPNEGSDNGGDWTIDLRRGQKASVKRGMPANDPDLRIFIAEDFLDDFASGSYDAEEAIAQEKIGLSGDWKVFERFVTLLVDTPTASSAKAGGGLEPPKSVGVGTRK